MHPGWTLELTGRTFSGTVNETTIAGRGTETGNAMSGGDTYPMTVTSSVTMRRQPMEQPDGLGAVRCLVKSFIYMGLSLTRRVILVSAGADFNLLQVLSSRAVPG